MKFFHRGKSKDRRENAVFPSYCNIGNRWWYAKKSNSGSKTWNIRKIFGELSARVFAVSCKPIPGIFQIKIRGEQTENLTWCNPTRPRQPRRGLREFSGLRSGRDDSGSQRKLHTRGLKRKSGVTTLWLRVMKSRVGNKRIKRVSLVASCPARGHAAAAGSHASLIQAWARARAERVADAPLNDDWVRGCSRGLYLHLMSGICQPCAQSFASTNVYVNKRGSSRARARARKKSTSSAGGRLCERAILNKPSAASRGRCALCGRKIYRSDGQWKKRDKIKGAVPTYKLAATRVALRNVESSSSLYAGIIVRRGTFIFIYLRFSFYLSFSF